MVIMVRGRSISLDSTREMKRTGGRQRRIKTDKVTTALVIVV